MNNFLKAVFLNKQVEIIGLGEINHGHHSIAFKDILMDKTQIKGIFLEVPVDFQSSVNNYLQKGGFDHRFEELLLGAIKEGKDFRKTYSIILNYARNMKTPVICVDSSKEKDVFYTQKSKYGSSYLKGKSRDEDMYTSIIKTIETIHGRWLLIAHASHLDTSFNMHNGDFSLGKRLMKNLGKKYFNVCLLNIPKSKRMEYFIGQELDTKLEALLMERNLGFLIKENRLKGFDALVIHP